MKIYPQKFGYSLLVVVLFFACKNTTPDHASQSTETPISANAAEGLPPDFMPFYMRFHTDSVYQMQHITFPVDGYRANVSLNAEQPPQRHRWTQEEWLLHRPLNNEAGDYRQEYEVLNNTVIEYIINDTEKMAMERRFSKLGGEWYLIYYMGMNRVSLE